MNNVELMAQALERAGARWVFGVPAGPVLPLIEALRGTSIEYVLTASETSAGFMASVVGALTGAPGVCLSTVGPGATNMATGVGAAWLDRAPVIAITGNVPSAWAERRIQMRIDHVAMFAPLTKAALPVRDGSAGDTITRAISIALAEPPGPVFLDLPEDVAIAEAGDEAGPVSGAPRLAAVPDAAIEAARIAIASAKRPLLVGGLSLARAIDPHRLVRFLEAQGMPFVLTLNGKGQLPESHPLYGGVIGRARRTDVAALVRQADLIVGVGYDPIEINYEEWAGQTPIVHFDTEAHEAAAAINFVVNAGGDLDATIDRLLALPAMPHAWTAAELAAHRERLDANLRPAVDGFAAHQALDILRAMLPADAILVSDVGAHEHQIGTQWRTDVRGGLLATNGWSSMGFGIPATYAAKLVHPERTVVGVIGDGCFAMTAGEIAVGRRTNLAAPIVVLDDGWLNLLRLKQDRKGYEHSGVDLATRVEPPTHHFGVPCRAAHTPDEFTAALEWALSLDGPSVIEALIDPESYGATVFD
jgi:acetolactate synthase I/II/III large subunit